MRRYQRHAETRADCRAPAEAVFAHLDNQEKLGAHMNKPSWMMLGGHMRYELDEGHGQRIGSVIRMIGMVAWVRLELEEIVLERDPPMRKMWATKGDPNLIVIGGYQMGFDVEPKTHASASVRVFVDYNLPRGLPSFLSAPVAGVYARWCVKRMAVDAARAFAGERQ